MFLFFIIIYRITVDYSTLPDHLKDLEDPDEIKKLSDKMAKTMAEQTLKLQKIHAPNFKVNFLRLIKMCVMQMFFFFLMENTR